MNVKHVLMIAAVLLAMLVMPVAAADEETETNLIISQESENQEVGATVINTIGSKYIVTIPENIPFDRGAEIKATDVVIGNGATLVVTVDSANDLVLKLDGSTSDSLKYTMAISGTTIDDGAEVLKIIHPLTSDTALLTFKTDDKAKKSGDYKDTLTFKVTVTPGTATNVPKEYIIDNLADLKTFRDLVNEGNTFKGWTVKLANDIDLGNNEWTPIGNYNHKFQGTFDGQGYTISNLSIQSSESYIGLFGYTTDGEIKNLIVENAKVTGYLEVGVVAGTPYTSKYTDITVKGHVEVNGFAYVGGVGGKSAYADWTDITVDVDETSYVRAHSINEIDTYRTYVGGVIGFMGEGDHKFTNVQSNIDVIGSTCDVGGITGIAHYGNSFINCQSSGDVEITHATDVGDAEQMGGIAGVWHNGGADVTFSNCKFTGSLTANINDGLDLTDNTIHGAAYSSSGSGNVIIN